MKRIIAIALLACAAAAFAQEKKEEEFNTVREFKTRMIAIHNRDARDIYTAVRLLGSGFKGSAMSFNEETRTITVRDFPENVATIEDAITRLDKALPPKPDIEMKISVLIGSKAPLTMPAVPDELEPVVKQLQSTLRYSHYGLLAAVVQRTKPSPSTSALEGSGVSDSSILGTTAPEGIFYSYRLNNISVSDSGEKPSIDVGDFKFGLRFPMKTGLSGYSYQNVGFNTPVSIRPNEKVVIGTTTMGDKAVIVVINATISGK